MNDPYVHKRLLDPSDFLETSYDRDCIEKYLGRPSPNVSFEVSTPTSARSDYVRDLYVTYKLNNDLRSCKAIWDAIVAELERPTVEDALWSVIFDLEAQIPVTFSGVNARRDVGYIATPYNIIREKYKNIELPKNILPRGDYWYFPTNTIDDVHALQRLHFKFDSTIERSATSIRWYHLVLSEVGVPTVSLPVVSPQLFESIPKREVSALNDKLVLYPRAWMTFIRGDRLGSDGRLIFNSGGHVVATKTKNLFLRGKAMFAIRGNPQQTVRYIDFKAVDLPQMLMPKQTLSVIINMNILNVYRYVRCYNAGGDSIELHSDSRSVEVRTDERSQLVVSSWLTRRPTVVLESRNIQWDSHANVQPDIVNKDTIKLTQCGYTHSSAVVVT